MFGSFYLQDLQREHSVVLNKVAEERNALKAVDENEREWREWVGEMIPSENKFFISLSDNQRKTLQVFVVSAEEKGVFIHYDVEGKLQLENFKIFSSIDFDADGSVERANYVGIEDGKPVILDAKPILEKRAPLL